jgi:hypothetical protein
MIASHAPSLKCPVSALKQSTSAPIELAMKWGTRRTLYRSILSIIEPMVLPVTHPKTRPFERLASIRKSNLDSEPVLGARRVSSFSFGSCSAAWRL